MEKKFSKGKWYQLPNSSKVIIVRTKSGCICELPKPRHFTGQDERYEKELEARKANAKLIAASPELLEALEDCIALLEECKCPDYLFEYYSNMIANYKELIEKATE